MKLLLIRHGIAEVRDVFRATGKTDDLRPLTDMGRDKMARIARGLKVLVPNVSLMASSPLVRARETAKIVADAYGMEVRETTEALTPDAHLPEFIDWLGARSEEEMVAAVGHEPHLSTLVTWLLAGIEEPRVVFKKGGAAMLEFRVRPRKGGAMLHWLAGPKALRQLGK
jgi:phosphohistidine phosphatase